jgi:hypothetical protein
MVCQYDLAKHQDQNGTQPISQNGFDLNSKLNKKSSSLNNLYSRPDSQSVSRSDLLKRDLRTSQSEFDIYQQTTKFDDNISDIVVDFSDTIGDYDDDHDDSVSQNGENITVINKQDINHLNDDENFLSSSPSLSIGDYKSFISEDVASCSTSSLSNKVTTVAKVSQDKKPRATQEDSVHTATQSTLSNDVTSLCSFQSNYSQFDYYFNSTSTKLQAAVTLPGGVNLPSKKFSFSFFNRFTSQNPNGVTGLFNKFFNTSSDKQPALQTIETAPNTVLILENRPRSVLNLNRPVDLKLI